jgi:paerucumarin biosynthesis protein PvcC
MTEIPANAASTQTAAPTNDLLNGARYLASLQDAREVYIYGERVKDVTRHPGFRNSCRSIARLYDALHDPQHRDTLTAIDRFGRRTHKFFMPSYNAQELLGARDAIVDWARMSYGFMGRTPDYKAALMASLASQPEFYAPFDNNARKWYARYSSQCLFLNHCLINPPVDRNRPAHEIGDVFVHVVKEQDGGIIVSGAKTLGTGSAMTHATFVAQNSATTLDKEKAKDFALVFIAPVDTPGTKLLCRPSYEGNAISPFDHPLSSRFDENDAVLLFDNAFIPWENVLVYRDPERANSFFRHSRFVNRYTLQSASRLAVKLDFVSGLFARAIEANGTDTFRGVQAAMGEILSWRNLIWSMTAAMCLDPENAPGGAVVPKQEYAYTLRVFGSQAWPAVRYLFEKNLAVSLLMTPSSYKDLQNEDLQPLIEKYYRGSSSTAVERIKLFKLIWDAIGTEFGARHELYEINYSGNHEQIRLDVLTGARQSGILDKCIALTEQCMSEYDLDGWKDSTWVWDKPRGTTQK